MTNRIVTLVCMHAYMHAVLVEGGVAVQSTNDNALNIKKTRATFFPNDNGKRTRTRLKFIIIMVEIDGA